MQGGGDECWVFLLPQTIEAQTRHFSAKLPSSEAAGLHYRAQASLSLYAKWSTFRDGQRDAVCPCPGGPWVGHSQMGEGELSLVSSFLCVLNSLTEIISENKTSLRVYLAPNSSEEIIFSMFQLTSVARKWIFIMIRFELHPQTVHTVTYSSLRSTERIMCVKLYLQLSNSS